jgi:ClpP class serine protease
MNLLHELLRSPWLITKEYSEGFFPLVENLLSGNTIPYELSEEDVSKKLESQSSFVFLNAGAPFTVNAFDVRYRPEEITEPTAFVLDLIGPISKYNQPCGPVGLKTKGDWLLAADAHPNVFAHVLKIDSGGGSGFASKHFSDVLSQVQKPVIAFIEDVCASAAYWIASNTDFVVASGNQSRIGSIGTYLSVVDSRKKLELQGLRQVDVYAEKSKDKNQDFLKAIDGDLSAVVKLAGEYNEFFITAVQQSRSSQLKNDSWNTGLMFFAQQAKSVGLIDSIMPYNEFLSEIFQNYSPKTN